MATPEASQSDEMITAAVLTADKQHHRGIEITGSDEFKERVFNLISEYNIEVKLTNPEQRVKLLELKKANETAKETAKKMLLIQMRISRKGQTKRQIHQFSRMECAGKNRPLCSRRSRMHLILKRKIKLQVNHGRKALSSRMDVLSMSGKKMNP